MWWPRTPFGDGMPAALGRWSTSGLLNSGFVVQSLTARAKSGSSAATVEGRTLLFAEDCARAAPPSAATIEQTATKSRAGRPGVGMTELLIIVIFSEALGTHYL